MGPGLVEVLLVAAPQSKRNVDAALQTEYRTCSFSFTLSVEVSELSEVSDYQYEYEYEYEYE
jgi:hypothetical protein